MENTDTVELLHECDAGTKMAVASIAEVLDKVHDSKLKNLLTESKEQHVAALSDICFLHSGQVMSAILSPLPVCPIRAHFILSPSGDRLKK